MPRWLYFLLIMAVIAPLIELIWGQQQEIAIFICSAISLVPLAVVIGRATEDLESHVGPVAGGLLNATFGNAPEIIIGIFALQQGLITVVKASIISCHACFPPAFEAASSQRPGENDTSSFIN